MSKTVTIVSYEYHGVSGATNRRRWQADTEHYEDRADADYSASLYRANADRYRKVHVQTYSLYTAGIHAGGIAKRKARLAAEA